ncbi:MAG: hypothetical protein ACRDF6_04900 [bacterium]
MRNMYGAGIVLLSGLSVLFALGILYGEATDRWSFGGGLVGALLLAYAGIVMFLRKLGIIGPRKAER